MRTLRTLAALPFLAIAMLAFVCETPFNAFGLLCVRTLELIAADPKITEIVRRLFLLQAVRCPRCGRQDVTVLGNVD